MNSQDYQIMAIYNLNFIIYPTENNTSINSIIFTLQTKTILQQKLEKFLLYP